MFHSKPNLKTTSKCRVLRFANYKVIAFLILLLLSHGDIEVNPGPKRKISKFSCCHWNGNSALAHDKLLIKSYNTVQKYDIICISETFLDLSANENSLLIPGYHLLRADHLNNLKKGDVCLYFKEDLSLRQIEILYFSWYIICELTIQNKVGNIVVIYHTPNQSVTEFDDFLVNFEKLLNHVRQLKSTFLLILGDFNARSKSWWCEDITSHKGPQIESLTMSWITVVSI